MILLVDRGGDLAGDVEGELNEDLEGDMTEDLLEGDGVR